MAEGRLRAFERGLFTKLAQQGYMPPELELQYLLGDTGQGPKKKKQEEYVDQESEYPSEMYLSPDQYNHLLHMLYSQT